MEGAETAQVVPRRERRPRRTPPITQHLHERNQVFLVNREFLEAGFTIYVIGMAGDLYGAKTMYLRCWPSQPCFYIADEGDLETSRALCIFRVDEVKKIIMGRYSEAFKAFERKKEECADPFLFTPLAIRNSMQLKTFSKDKWSIVFPDPEGFNHVTSFLAVVCPLRKPQWGNRMKIHKGDEGVEQLEPSEIQFCEANHVAPPNYIRGRRNIFRSVSTFTSITSCDLWMLSGKVFNLLACTDLLRLYESRGWLVKQPCVLYIVNRENVPNYS
jgi:hypothetical protein